MEPQQSTYQAPLQPQPAPAPVQYPPEKNTKGIIFGVVVGVILIAISLFIGMTLGQSSQKSASQVKIDAANKEIDRLKRTYSGEEIPDLPGVTYLSIKEWNIRLPLDSKFKDVKYKVRTRLNADFIELYSPSLVPIATCRDYQGEVGTIERAATGTVPIPTANVVGIGKYLYMYKEKAETCTTNPANLETPMKASLIKQFAGLEELPNSQRTEATDDSATTSKQNSSSTSTQGSTAVKQ